jgi:hypothetical protein
MMTVSGSRTVKRVDELDFAPMMDDPIDVCCAL